MPVGKRPTLKLTQDSIERLRSDPSASARAETAASVAAVFASNKLTNHQRHIAVEILEHLARDVEQQVRQALCDHVMHCPFLPPGIARTLASDVESIAVPIIRYSAALGESDLVEIVREGSITKQLAVAERESIPPKVSDAIAETGEKNVIETLLANHGAEFADTSLDKVMDRFSDDEVIQILMVERPSLPIHITERLIAKVSTVLLDRLEKRHGFPSKLAGELIRHSRERALAEVVGSDTPPEDVELLVDVLLADGTLSPTFLLRALCAGDSSVLEIAMARLTGIPTPNARILINDAGAGGFRALYSSSNLPPELFSAFRVALDVVQENKLNGRSEWDNRDTGRIIKSLVLNYRMLCPEDLENVLVQLDRHVINPAAMPPMAFDSSLGTYTPAAQSLSN